MSADTALNSPGALYSRLAPTAIALATYFCIADMILISQCLYYNAKNAARRRVFAAGEGAAHRRGRRHRSASDASTCVDEERDGSSNSATTTPPDEEAPLLAGGPGESGGYGGDRRRSRSNAGSLPGSRRYHSNAPRRESSALDPLTRIVTGENDLPDEQPWLHNALSILAVFVVGLVGFTISYRMGVWDMPQDGDGAAGEEALDPIGQSLGYASAVCYLW